MPQFQPQADPTNTGARWTAWIERFETYLNVTYILFIQ